MKKFTFFLFFISTITAYSQFTYSPNTIYMIPPTSGCDGEWAVLDTACASFLCTYNINPFSCSTINHRSGDTLFLNLCSIPCDIVETNDFGDIVFICSVDFATAIKKNILDNKINLYPNPNNGTFTVKHNLKSENYVLEIVDLMGKVVHREKLTNSNQQEIKTPSLNKGIYFVNIKSEVGELVYSSKMSVMK